MRLYFHQILCFLMVLRKLYLVQDIVLSHGLVEVANDMKCVIIKKESRSKE